MSNFKNLFLLGSFFTLSCVFGMEKTGMDIGESSNSRMYFDSLHRKIVEDQSKTQKRLNEALTHGEDFTRVIFVGMVGSGKSTLLNALAGCTLQVKEENLGFVLDPAGPGIKAPVGHRAAAETGIPNIWKDEVNKIIYCDCPGFWDTTPSKRIINAFTIDRLFKEPCKIKVLVVVGAPEFRASRGQSVNKTLDMLCSLLPNPSQRQQCIGIVTTKTDARTSPVKLLGYLSSVAGHNSLVDDFLKSSSEVVFDFPKPRTSTGIYNLFADRGRMVHFFKKKAVENPQHSIVLDESTQLSLSQVTHSFNEEAERHLLAFTKKIEKSYREVSRISALQRWTSTIKSINEAADNLEHFIEGARSQLVMEDGFEESIDALEELIPWQQFVSKYLNSSALDLKKMLGPIFESQLKELENLENLQRQKEERIEEDRRRTEQRIQEIYRRTATIEEETSKPGWFKRFIHGVGSFIGGAFELTGELLTSMAELSNESNNSNSISDSYEAGRELGENLASSINWMSDKVRDYKLGKK